MAAAAYDKLIMMISLLDTLHCKFYVHVRCNRSLTFRLLTFPQLGRTNLYTQRLAICTNELRN